MVDLPQLLGVDLAYCEQAATSLIGAPRLFSGSFPVPHTIPPTPPNPPAARAPSNLIISTGEGSDVKLIEGELLTPQYFDNVALEVAEELAAAGSLPLADLARRLSLSVDLLTSALQDRVGRLVRSGPRWGQAKTPR